MLSTPDNTVRITGKSSGTHIDRFGEKVKKSISRPQKKLNKAEIETIVKKYRSGISTKVLAKEFGCHRDTISRQLKKQGIEVTAEKVGISQQGKMVQLYRSGLTAQEVAIHFGVSKTTALNHLRDSGVEMRGRWGDKYEEQTFTNLLQKILYAHFFKST